MKTATRPSRPLLIVTASMGSGHTQVATELARRLSDRVPVRMIDLLDVLPPRVGTALRRGYERMIHRAPWLYEAIFQAFFVPRGRVRPSTSPLVGLAARRLLCVVRGCRPCAVVSTFHLAGQAVGLLRRRGPLAVPSVVLVTEPAAHLLWSDPGTDLFVCPYPWVAEDLRRATGKPALAPGPVVNPAFRADSRADRASRSISARRRMGLWPGEHAVLISGGSWGVGDVGQAAGVLADLPGVRPVVLCGHNEDLRQRLTTVAGCTPLGWREDLPTLFHEARVLVDNAGGTTCAEAFAAGLPVVGYRPLPGHGRAGMRELVRAGLVTDGEAALPAAVAALLPAGPLRGEQCRRAAGVFRRDPADLLADRLALASAPVTGPTER